MAIGSDNFLNVFNGLSKAPPLLMTKPDGAERDDAQQGL
jgi:hypothetical protein